MVGVRTAGVEVKGGVVAHAAAEEFEAVRGESEADGMGVAAKLGEEGGGTRRFVDGGEGVEEMEAGDGASGAVGGAVLVGEDEGGPVGAFDDTGG